MHYVLGLWDRLIHSIPYLKSDKPHNLQAFTPQIMEAYLKVRAGHCWLAISVLRGRGGAG